MNKTIMMRRRITALDSMGQSELEDKFHELFGIEAPKSNARNLRMRLAWKIQEELFGGISNEDMERLKAIADADPLANLSRKECRKSKILSGTRYKKTWKGKTYYVTVQDDGKFEFEGITYRSLSAIADKITGTHWNGKKFFGVK